MEGYSTNNERKKKTEGEDERRSYFSISVQYYSQGVEMHMYVTTSWSKSTVSVIFRESICHQSVNNSEERSIHVYHAAAQAKRSITLVLVNVNLFMAFNIRM